MSKPLFLRCAASLAACAVLVAGSAHASEPDSGKEEKKFSAGLTFSDKARAEDAGLPLYPGAVPYRDRDENGEHKGDGVNLGFWGGSFGLKIVVVKLSSSDSVEQVAAFYQPALAEYGEVLDCSKGRPEERRERKSKILTCENDKAKRNGQLFKSGTRDKQRIVSLRPDGKGTKFELIYIEKKGTD